MSCSNVRLLDLCLDVNVLSSRGSLVGILPRLRVGGFGVRIPAEVRDFSLSQMVGTGSGGLPALLGFLPVDKAVGASS